MFRSSLHYLLIGSNLYHGMVYLVLSYLPNPGIKPTSPVSPALAGGFFTTAPPGKPRPEADGFKIWGSEFQSQLSQGTLGIHLLDPDRLGEIGLIPGRLHILWVRTFEILSLKGLNQIFLIPLNASQASFAIQEEKWNCLRVKWDVRICWVEQRKSKKWENRTPGSFSFLNFPPLTFSQYLKRQFGFSQALWLLGSYSGGHVAKGCPQLTGPQRQMVVCGGRCGGRGEGNVTKLYDNSFNSINILLG